MLRDVALFLFSDSSSSSSSPPPPPSSFGLFLFVLLAIYEGGTPVSVFIEINR